MKIELRERGDGDHHAVIVSETKAESLILDRVFGTQVDGDGLVGQRKVVECRLGDGFREHYLYIK